jgi:flagellar biosynthesis protein FlhG
MAKSIAIASGKGGVGKTNFCSNLAVHLAAQGYKICIFDADFGCANLNIIFGLYPHKTIADVIFHGVPLKDIIIKNCNGIDIIPGSPGIEELANLDPEKIASLIESFSILDKYDYVFFDTGAGVAKNVVSFCLAASATILVVTPEPTSLTDAYALLKILCMNGLDSPVKTVVNQCKDTAMAKTTCSRLEEEVEKYLCVDLQPIGFIAEDPNVSEAVKRQRPYTLLYPDTNATKCISGIAKNFIQGMARNKQEQQTMKTFWQECIAVFKGRLQVVLASNDKKLVKRKFRRFPIDINAQYGFNGKKIDKCQLYNVSSEGLAIKLNLPEVAKSSNLSVYLSLPEKQEEAKALLKLKWVEALYDPKEFNYNAGGTFTGLDSHCKNVLLEHAYTKWFQNV